MRPALGLLGGAALAWALTRRRTKPFSFRGKIVLVTGGSRGLGFVLAREVAAAGGRVVICGRDGAALERAAAELHGVSFPAITIQADVGDAESVRRLVDTVNGSVGPIDVLINVAGIIEVGPAVTMGLSDFHEAMNTNFWGTVHTTLEVLPGMRRRRSGRIINVTSIGGRIAVPHLLPYSASKFAAFGFSQGLRAEVAGDGVVVTTVVPGLMRTGSPRNAVMRGRHRAEYAWFSIADSTPVLSVSAEDAAQRILAAARRGDAEVRFPVVARAAILASAVAPNATASVLALAGRLLPGPPQVASGRRPGRESQSPLSPSVLTRTTERAAKRFNQIAPTEDIKA